MTEMLVKSLNIKVKNISWTGVVVQKSCVLIVLLGPYELLYKVSYFTIYLLIYAKSSMLTQLQILFIFSRENYNFSVFLKCPELCGSSSVKLIYLFPG